MSVETGSAVAGRPGERAWSDRYLARKGIGAGAFAHRLARARMIHLRRREVVWYWLALAILAGCWDVAGRLDAESDAEAPQAHAAAINYAHAGGRLRTLPEAPGGISARLGKLARSFRS